MLARFFRAVEEAVTASDQRSEAGEGFVREVPSEIPQDAARDLRVVVETDRPEG